MSDSDSKSALATAVTAAKEYADLILKGPLGEIGGILTDVIGQWRLRNQVRLFAKTKLWLEQRNVDPKPISPEVLVPLVQEASNVEDETLADMFASLLATHLDRKHEEETHPSYAKVLAQLSSTDAKVMLVFLVWVSYPQAREVGLPGRGISVGYAAEELSCSVRSTYLSCLNLHRLGIIEHRGFEGPRDDPISGIFEHSPGHQVYRATEYGIAFSAACHYEVRAPDA